MANTYGIKTLFTETLGRTIQVSADGAPKYKAGGVTVDWTSIPACPANGDTYYGKTVASGKVTFEDGVEVKTGEKAIRYGSVLVYDATQDAVSSTTGGYILAVSGTLVRSQTFIVNETWLEDDYVSSHPGVMDGGRMFRDRIVTSGSAPGNGITVYVTGGSTPPTNAQVEAAMPAVLWALDN